MKAQPRKQDKRNAGRFETIGIPRGLLWHKYGVFWREFFENLGYMVIESPETDKAIFDEGERLSSDEVCLASKAYLGHVSALQGQCDAIFIPCHDNCDVRAGFCTKYQSLPDMVKATLRDTQINVITLRIPEARNIQKSRAAYVEFAADVLGHTKRDATKAFKNAMKKQRLSDHEKTAKQEELFRKLYKTETTPLTILLMAHPYIGHDDYIAGDIIRSLQEMDAAVIFADEGDHDTAFKKSFEFSETLPWIINRELVGSLMLNKHRVDGVILLSAFPCGPDSMFDDAVMRRFKDLPILNLMIDSLSGTAGVQTRVESFIDILRFKKKGSYLGEDS